MNTSNSGIISKRRLKVSRIRERHRNQFINMKTIRIKSNIDTLFTVASLFFERLPRPIWFESEAWRLSEQAAATIFGVLNDSNQIVFVSTVVSYASWFLLVSFPIKRSHFSIYLTSIFHLITYRCAKHGLLFHSGIQSAARVEGKKCRKAIKTTADDASENNFRARALICWGKRSTVKWATLSAAFALNFRFVNFP